MNFIVFKLFTFVLLSVCVALDPLIFKQKLFDHGLPFVPPDLRRPLIIGHRGSSGSYPEHTEIAYGRAIEEGADAIECDVVLSEDLVPICNHDVVLSRSTDVKSRPEFEAKLNFYKQSDTSDGVIIDSDTDYYAIDFTLKELKTLKRVQSLPFRDQSFNGQYDIVTLKEFISIAKRAEGVVIIYPEIKEPRWHNLILQQRGHQRRIEDIVIETLREEDYVTEQDPCIIQCFDVESLNYIKTITSIHLIVLTETEVSAGDLKEWGSKFYGIGCWKALISKHWTQSNGYKNYITGIVDLVELAHKNGLRVHVFTFRNEDKYLAWDYHQDPVQEYMSYCEMEVDGFITDFPATASSAIVLSAMDSIKDNCDG